MEPIGLTGQKFGRWTTIKTAGENHWFCECRCGTQRNVLKYTLLNGSSKSCGCLQRENVSKKATKHGLAKTPLYKVWGAMKQRCYNPKDKGFINYGGRGITICKRWDNFVNFYKDMGSRPKGMMLERIKNDGNYEPNNCKWATRKEQNRNSRHNRMIIYQGQQKCLNEWAYILGVKYQTLTYRLENYSIEKAFTFRRRDSKQSRIFKYHGERKSIVEWAEKFGINYKALWWRLQHYPPQIAFNMKRKETR
ncbi:MAG: hypothetical protein Q8K02_02270 [Flavobacterium sp.]|nr:hypothetical protein [Flavobacterium sp.]